MVAMLSRIRTIAIAACALGLASASAAQAPAEQTAVKAVAKIYQDFAAEAVIDTADLSILDLFSRPKATLARYLDDDLVALVMADRDCSRRKNEVCNLDFAPIWDAQDMVGTTVKIDEGKDAAHVKVELHFPPNTIRRLTYVMVKTAAGWRVHDIEYDSHESLVKMLKGKP
jgi:hypothetical protein